MNLLYALIAFSVVMIVASTLVVALVRLLQDLRRQRRRHLRYMLGAFFDEYLWPELGEMVQDLPQRLRRNLPEHYTAKLELEPVRAWWQNLFVAADLWSAMWALGDSAKTPRPTHGWHRGWHLAAALLFWLVIIAFTAWCLSQEVVLPVLILVVAIFFGIDATRETDRDRFAVWSGVSKLRRARLMQLDKLQGDLGRAPVLADLGQAPGFAGLPETERSALLADHSRLTRRRAFVDEMVNSAKSLAARRSGETGEAAEQIDILDLIQHLGHTEFGEALHRVALSQKDRAQNAVEDATNRLLDDLSRRYDTLCGQCQSQFRANAARWSVGLAFVVAFAANVDAPYVFQTLYENPQISQKVQTEFDARVEAMAMQEADLLAEIADKEAKLTEEQAANDEELKTLKQQLKEYKDLIGDSTEELAALGVPVGWDYFPYCLKADGKSFPDAEALKQLRDPRCQALARSLSVSNTEVKLRLSGLIKIRLDGGSRGIPPAEGDSAPGKCDDGAFCTLKAYVMGTADWIAIRRGQGMLGWIFGALLGGALIGLGGPFWFDLYKRISALARLGTAALSAARGPATASATAGAATEQLPPDQQHRPQNVRDAFHTARDAQQRIDRARAQNASFDAMAALAEGADESQETPTPEPPADGGPEQKA